MSLLPGNYNIIYIRASTRWFGSVASSFLNFVRVHSYSTYALRARGWIKEIFRMYAVCNGGRGLKIPFCVCTLWTSPYLLFITIFAFLLALMIWWGRFVCSHYEAPFGISQLGEGNCLTVIF